MTPSKEKDVTPSTDETSDLPATEVMPDDTSTASAHHLKHPDAHQASGEQPTAAQHRLTTPGELLQKARERAQISIEQVAAHHKLKVDYLTSLENNQYGTQCMAPVFIKGHLRNLAKYLSIDPDYLIECYVTYADNTETTVSPKLNAETRATQKTSLPSPSKWLTDHLAKRLGRLRTSSATRTMVVRTTLALCVLLSGGLIYGLWPHHSQQTATSAKLAQASAPQEDTQPIQSFTLISNQQTT